MTWTPVLKPTDATYTRTNVQGREQYDQSSITYDDPGIFYDGVDMAAWTDIAKPTLPITRVGISAGLLIPLTIVSSTVGTDWTSVNKPTT